VPRGSGAGSESARLLTTTARSFLRFLFLRRRTGTDLSVAIPRFLQRKRPAPPRVLSAEEVERVLAVPDRGTPKGRRDYAVLLLLARLGLRAGEIVGLRLEDVDWRAGELVVKGKTRRTERLPLLREVGAALADYLRDRGRSACRRVFQRKHPPCVGFSGPAAVGHVVRAAMRRAAVPRGSRGAAHLFRHSLASRMLRRGAALPEIGGVLRHRSISSTERYARVDPATLRRAALPWPHDGAAP
jgi:integrase/recombinase XerD